HCIKCGQELPPSVLPVEPAPGQGQPQGETRRPVRRPRSEEEWDDDHGHDSRQDGGITTLIPYHNPKALAAYYCGFFALLPIVGLALAPVSIILGFLGVRHARDYPETKGTAHAIIGIVLGLLSLLCNPIITLLAWWVWKDSLR